MSFYYYSVERRHVWSRELIRCSLENDQFYLVFHLKLSEITRENARVKLSLICIERVIFTANMWFLQRVIFRRSNHTSALYKESFMSKATNDIQREEKKCGFPYENRFHQYIDSIKKNTRTIAYDTLSLPCISNCNM